MTARPKIAVFCATVREDYLRGFCPARDDDFDVSIVETADYEPCDVAVIYGCEKPGDGARRRFINSLHRNHNGLKIIVESGFFGRQHIERKSRSLLKRLFVPDRRPIVRPVHTYLRVGLGGAFAHDADFVNSNSPPDRWRALQEQFGLELAPYRTDGRHILIALQVPDDASLFGTDLVLWLTEVTQRLVKLTNRPIKVRCHPHTPVDYIAKLKSKVKFQNVSLLPIEKRDISVDLKDCWATVMYSSGSSIDSLLAGVPPICLSPANLAYASCSKTLDDIERPLLPEREQLMYDLSYAQWSREEIASGLVWSRLRGRVLQELAPRTAASRLSVQ